MDRVPRYVLDHAPLVHLNSNEKFWPSKLEKHLKNCLIYYDRPIETEDHDDDEGDLFSVLTESNEINCKGTFLTSLKDVRPSPEKHPWIVSLEGKPDPKTLRSDHSPAILILVDKSKITGVEGTLDAFWFFFYSFNLGPKVAGFHFGNHIADWEHCMIRFLNGKPQAVHLSSHADGFSYKFDCLEKFKEDSKRPIIYSATGSHAMYPKPGYHDYSPVKIIGPIDHTDRGPLWDPSLNFLPFQHFPSPSKDKFITLKNPTENGNSNNEKYLSCLKWGDEFSYDDSKEVDLNPLDQRSKSKRNLVGDLKKAMLLERLRWCDGVTGPRDKDLDRAGMNRFGKHIRLSI
ncbi:hypothetical protein PPACK8108_LOCUS13070 [Phakopsora pachyrhizi]|uniref:Uncharacterized protein n=1 Tax=Phakopsora pachyrhizi TaxID=170000 RepID=A0AAV0B565_PHAPC|nr:hypothetical protein PPACK8108_LOCUS13070 [Phakopsora pachyrhizi]